MQGPGLRYFSDCGLRIGATSGVRDVEFSNAKLDAMTNAFEI
jgi:hypothetical protein